MQRQWQLYPEAEVVVRNGVRMHKWGRRHTFPPTYSAGNLGVNGVVSSTKLLTVTVYWSPRRMKEQTRGYWQRFDDNL